MSHTEPAWSFKLMALGYRFRDMRKPRAVFLDEAGIADGFTVLDFGCGPGSYVVPAAQKVGRTGRVYALDICPTAIEMVTERIEKEHLANVTTILSDCDTGLDEESVDVVLLYDIFHDLSDPAAVLSELRRVLKPEGILSSHDHHLKGELLKDAIESAGPFRLVHSGTLTQSFAAK